MNTAAEPTVERTATRFETLIRQREHIARDLASWMAEWRTEWHAQGLPGDGSGVLKSLDERAAEFLARDDLERRRLAGVSRQPEVRS